MCEDLLFWGGICWRGKTFKATPPVDPLRGCLDFLLWSPTSTSSTSLAVNGTLDPSLEVVWPWWGRWYPSHGHEWPDLIELLHNQYCWVYINRSRTQPIPPEHLWIHYVCIVLQREHFFILNPCGVSHGNFLPLHYKIATNGKSRLMSAKQKTESSA